MGAQLAVNVEAGGNRAEGCCTPQSDKSPQKMSVLPKRVLPIIFLPGIMGSNLRMSSARQRELECSNNIAWRPDRLVGSAGLLFVDAADRQSRLDPDSTEVDIYDPEHSPTGDPSETAAERHDVGDIHVYFQIEGNTPLLIDDPRTMSNRKTKEQKAMERGWGEVYFSSYGRLLESCEKYLNKFILGKFWQSVLDKSPEEFKAFSTPSLTPLSEAECRKALAGCFFPVHAIGYNWLKSNASSAVAVAARVRTLMEKYRSQGYQCEKVIVITHSMGGLVARALVHPEMGGLAEQVLGIVHGAMPAIGAPAAYKRMRSGFEEGFAGASIPPKVLGNYGYEVTAVMANSQGGLELLPSKAYGNGWLRVRRKGGVVLTRLPQYGDPYKEIYQLQGKWYGLLREQWINPARRPGRGFQHTCNLLEEAKLFHERITSTYHSCSYAHYSADVDRASWEFVDWVLNDQARRPDWSAWNIASDNGQGHCNLLPTAAKANDLCEILVGPSTGAGDQTVPLRSSEHQLLSGKFKGVFRQSGYEHQGSYKDETVLKATMFSLVRIIQTMQWSSNA
ncbi:PGAP1-like alpha/beta domain-containing protein [Duganella sp. PWIR1]